MTARSVPIVRSELPIIVGSGVAGLTTALGLSGCTVITAQAIGGGSSSLAQGGVAAAVGAGDNPAGHVNDTLAVGGRIADDRIATLVAKAASAQIGWFVELGAHFDTDAAGALSLGREAGHSEARIVHAGGDATGAELMRVLRLATASRSDIEVLARTRIVDLVRSGDRIVGVVTAGVDGAVTVRLAPNVVLATGGIGGVYQRSTNPADVTGAGLAVAARQGAVLADLEFVQFHPTALTVRDHEAPLVTEALRGEGATLIDHVGRRFMLDVHPDVELAPRDVVARAVGARIGAGHSVRLDASAAIGAAMPHRFPTVFSLAMEAGIDPRTEPIPIAPAQHFHMGGIDVDAEGRTSLMGLWAVGEVASTGLHGANRLASNSLLEAAVMGQRASAVIEPAGGWDGRGELLVPTGGVARAHHVDQTALFLVRSVASGSIGLERDQEGLTSAIETLSEFETVTDAVLVASLIAEAALVRTESRGAHYRSDHPSADPLQARRSRYQPLSVALEAIDSRSKLVSR
jgi:L-aspartate oxidase